jgi:hypothetical protein
MLKTIYCDEKMHSYFQVLISSLHDLIIKMFNYNIITPFSMKNGTANKKKNISN